MSEANPNRVTLTIYGKIYTFAPNCEQDAEFIQQVAQLVDDKMHQVHQVHHTQSPGQTAILAGLELVDELFKLRTEYQAAESDIASRTSKLTASLNRVFQESKSDPSFEKS